MHLFLLSMFLKGNVWNLKSLMLLNRPCSCSRFTCSCVNTKNLILVTLIPSKNKQVASPNTHAANITVHPTACAFWNPRNQAVKVLATHSPGPSPLWEVEVCAENRVGVRNGDTWSSGMLGQALQSPDTTYRDQTRFHPRGTKQVPKPKPQHHLGAQTQSNKRNSYELKADFTLLPWNTLSPHHWQAGSLWLFLIFILRLWMNVVMTFVIPIITCQMHLPFMQYHIHHSPMDFYFVNRALPRALPVGIPKHKVYASMLKAQLSTHLKVFSSFPSLFLLIYPLQCWPNS